MVLALLVSLSTPLHASWWSLSVACLDIATGCWLRFARIDRPQDEPSEKRIHLRFSPLYMIVGPTALSQVYTVYTVCV